MSFYPKDEIEDSIKCPNCSKLLEDPRVLPCGTTMCEKCLKTMLDDCGLNCSVCLKIHLLPENDEFPKNLQLVKLLEAKPKDIYRGTGVEDLKSCLTILKQKNELFEKNIEKSFDDIQKYSSYIRTELKTYTDNLILKIKEANQNLLNTIESHEYESLCSLQNRASNLELNKTIPETKKFIDGCEEILKRPKLNEKEVIDAQKQVDFYLLKLEIDEKLHANCLTEKNMLKLYPNSTITDYSSLIGTLNSIKMEKKLIESMADLNFTNYSFYAKQSNMCPCNSTLTHCFKVSYMKNSFKVLNFKCERTTLLLVLDQDNNLVKKKIFLCDEISVVTDRINYIFILLTESKDEKFIISMDLNLNFLAIVYVCNSAYCIVANELNLFHLTNDEKAVKAYDKCLNLLLELGQNSAPNLPFYFPNNIQRLEVTADKFIYLKNGEINVMEIGVGIILCKFPIKGQQFTLSKDQHFLLTLDVEFIVAKIRVYTIDGTKLEEKPLNFLYRDVCLTKDEKKRITFLDQSE